MKRISTLFVLAVLFAVKANAQFSENFDAHTAASLNAASWQFNSATLLTSGSNKYIGLAITGAGANMLATPYLTPNGTTVNISFTTQLQSGLTGGGNRSVQVSYGAISVGSFTYNTSSTTAVEPRSFNVNLSGISASERLSITVSGSGNGSTSIYFDNIVVTGVNSAGTAGSISFAPLPIKLLSFGGNLHNNKAQLKWSVDENETGDHFVIEKSADGKNFSEAGVVFVTAKAGTENYSYNEATEMSSAGYFRLKIVNKNNSVSYSRIIALRAVKANGNGLSIMQNPVRSTLAINYTVSNTGLSEINLYNAAGVKVFATKQQSQKGINAASFNLDNHVTPGTYVLEVINGTERNLAKMIKL